MYRAKAKSLQTVYKVYFQYMRVNMIWDVYKFTVQKAKKGIKRCISVIGVQLWNNVEMDVRMVNSFLVFKGIICETILEL